MSLLPPVGFALYPFRGISLDLMLVKSITSLSFLRVLRMGYVEIVGRFARLAMIECIYRGETGFGFSCGHSENPKPVSPHNLR